LSKNVIIILIDGGRLDRAKKFNTFKNLESNSIFFPNSITYAPYTTGAMHAVFSGCYGNRTGTDSYWHIYQFRKNQFLTLTEYLKQNGHYTFADGHSELIIPKQGFDEFNIHDENKVDLIDHHSNLLSKMKDIENKGKNFFLFLTYSNIHTGIMNNVLKVFNNFSKEYFENKYENEKRYDELFKNADTYMEKILQKINELEFDKNSIIVVLSDHGISLGEKFGERAYGAFCYDYTIKTFCYIKSPEIEPKIIHQQVRHVDIMPTILDMLGISLSENHENLDGISLMPVIKGTILDEHVAYSETGNPLDENAPPKEPNIHSIRTTNWKLIYNSYNNSKELYDLKTDPDENNNLIGKELEIEKILWNHLLKIKNKNF
jgi:arylsulfatase A-like enzyme